MSPAGPSFALRMIASAACLLAIPLALGAGTNSNLPSLSPQINSVFPRGIQAGTQREVQIRGTFLEDARDITFSVPGIKAKVTSSEFRLVTVSIRAEEGVLPDCYPFRLVAGSGTRVASFCVGSFPEVFESDANDSPETAQRIAYPTVINGTADAADADYFQFHAAAGQTLVFDITAQRAGSRLDPVLGLLDGRGTEIAYSDDIHNHRDARIVHTFAESGEYSIRVSASFERSAKDADYRLLVTDTAFPTSLLPAGGGRGSAAEVEIRGVNLASIDRLWLDDRALDAEFSNAEEAKLRARFTIPADLPAAAHYLHVASKEDVAPVALPFVVSEGPEITVRDAEASNKEKPLRVALPVVINGEISGQRTDTFPREHFFEFEAKAGMRIEFGVEAWELGFDLDPMLTLYDSSWNELLFEDDPAPNAFIHYAASQDPTLVYHFEKDGLYRLMTRGAAYETGEGRIYRLAIRETTPAFEVEVRTADLTVHRGGAGTVLAIVKRTGGVHQVEGFHKPDSEIEQFRLKEIDGWNTPISVELAGLPAGVLAEKVEAPPENTVFKGNDGEELFVDGTAVEIPVHAAADALAGLYQVEVWAEGIFEGTRVRRRGRIVLARQGAPPRSDDHLSLTVVDPPPLLLQTPDTLTLSQGQTMPVKVSVYRFSRSGAPVELSVKGLPEGIVATTTSLAGDQDEAEVLLTASAEAPQTTTSIIFEGASRTGEGEELVAESPAVELRVQPAKP